MLSRNLRVLPPAKHGRSASIRIHADEIVRRQWKAAIFVMDRFRVVQEESAFGLIESSLLAAQDEGAEFERSVNILEENFLVLKIEQAANPSVGRNGLEESSRSLVGVNARRR